MVSASISTPIIAPSILSADFARLADEVAAVPSADWLHIDVMDNHFVPNLTFGLPVVKAVAKVTDKPLDCHLMIEDPARWALEYAEFFAVTFHLEAVDSVEAAVELARALRSRGTRAGISVKPGTPVQPLLPVLDEFDQVLVMSVEPGFGGQKFMPEVLDKVRALRAHIDAHGLNVLIEIDGGIGPGTIADAAEAGVDAFVAGSAVYGADDPDEAIRALRASVR